MEKNITIFVMLVMLLMFHGLIHGKRFDHQSTRLKALRDAKTKGADQITFVQEEFEWKMVSKVTVDDEVGNMEDDLIEGGLPGQPFRVEFKQFSGYVSVDKLKGRNLFYYFVEAVHDSSSKPLVLWLNGGPGCSSVGVGAMLEIGPFGVEPNGRTLYRRRTSWNQAANILFLESPAGVGFSYSNNTLDYKITGDKSTAQDSYSFLVKWLKRFPQYTTREFFITGESYAGYYIPELADIIIKENAINLKGIMIGNGIMNDVTDVKGQVDYFWSHALISDETHQGLTENCNKNKLKCQYYNGKILKEIGKIEFYNIYAPMCNTTTISPSSSTKINREENYVYDPCEENYVFAYLNRPDVQEVLRANTTKLPYTWDFCSNLLDPWHDSPSTMFPIYRRLISSGLRIVLYSGDVDSVVPVTGTRYSIDALNLTISKPWHPWLDEINEVGGYRVVYEGLTFATVRGAGHEVPRFVPSRALTLFKYFLSDK